MNPAFSEFMESSCLALAREVPEFPTQMGMFEIAGESVPQDYFTGIDAGSVARRQQLLLNIGKQLNRFSHEDLDESEQLSAGVLDFLVALGDTLLEAGDTFAHFAHQRRNLAAAE